MLRYYKWGVSADAPEILLENVTYRDVVSFITKMNVPSEVQSSSSFKSNVKTTA